MTFYFGQTEKKVLIIGIDGVRSDAFIQAQTPTIDALIENGIYSPNALNDDITISGPGWSAILCGVWSTKHLVTDNDFTINDYESFPSLFRHAEEYDPSISTLSICHWDPINDYIVQNFVDFKLNVSTDAEVSNQASSYISSNDPDLIFLHFDDVDHAGHSYGFSPNVSQYISAIETTDSHLIPIINAIEQRPNYANEDWLILISSDHGGVGNSHGGTSIEHREVPFIVSGNNIPTQIILKDSSLVSNNAFNCLGDEAELTFDGNNAYMEVPSNTLFDFGDNQDFTVECRVRTTSSGDVAIIGNKDWDSGVNPGFVFSFKYPAGPEWKVNIGDGSSREDIEVGGLIADNEWHTLSVSFDRDGMMKMYEDGQFISEADISGIGNINSGQGLFIGADINSSYDFQGSVAEVRTWNTILDANTIADWHCNTLENSHPNSANLIGYWKMNEGTGNQVIDASGNENNGNIINAIWDNSDSSYVYNYDATPKITDIAVTALTHLCVNITPPIEFDGISWVDSCSTNTLNELDNGQINIHPNPTNDILNLKFMEKNSIYSIYSSNGKLMCTGETSGIVDVTDLQRGVYFIEIDGSIPKNIKFSKL
ncbi:MAG: alkaline phosphatase family protein [Crocinitomicaceae bacterium]|nr:alkaline phosphatase family protein [Crocinitomicaceae bacterium]